MNSVIGSKLPMYNFPEAKLGPNFAQDKLQQFKAMVNANLSFVVISMPGVGVSYFLRYLATRDWACFYHVDLYSLPMLTRHEFYKLLLTELGGKPASKNDEQLLQEIRKTLKAVAEKREKIVIIFSRFDQLKKEFDRNFLSNIQSLNSVSPGRIVLIFTSTKPLPETAPEALTGGNLNFYSENLYFKPYSREDLKQLLKIEPPRPGLGKLILEKALELCGGHNQLLHILLSSQKQGNLLLDRFAQMQMKEFIDYLQYQQKKTLQKIAQGKTPAEADEYLLGVGLVKKNGPDYSLFTPLLTEYIRTKLPNRLPVKEAKLFKLLKNNRGKVVSKDEIFAEVWEGSEEGATDWALDALIYRLRKHPFIKSNGYIIESHKKVGYTLIQA